MEDRSRLAFKLNLDCRPRKMLFYLLTNIGKQKGTDHLSLTLERPVQVAFFLVVLEKLRGHDDHAAVRLPDHLPKMRDGIFFRPLRANVFLLHFKTIAEIRVDVIVFV